MLFGDVLSIVARRRPDATAVVFEDRRITYRALDSRTNRLANALLHKGLSPGDRVAYLLPNGLEILECHFGTAKAGIVGVPLNTRLSPDELAAQIDDSGSCDLIIAAEFEGVLTELAKRLPDLRFIVTGGPGAASGVSPRVAQYEDVVATGGEEEHHPPITEDSPCYIMYTGGTTGLPKGAVQTHRNWVSCAVAVVVELELQRSDVHLMTLPMYHVSWWSVVGHLYQGAATVLLERWDPVEALRLMEAEGVTTTNMVPTMLGDLLAANESRGGGDFPALRLLTTAGSAISPGLYDRASRVFGGIVGTLYGLTETVAGPVTYIPPRELNGHIGRLASCGKEAGFTELQIWDEECRPLPHGEVGEIVLRGAIVTPGYWNRDRENEVAFHGGWFHTGDLAHMDAEGYVYIVDRAKDMIKSGGENVYSREVEDVLYTHPAVQEAAVIGIPDARWMEAVHAVVVLNPGATVAADELIEHCKQRIARYKAPKSVEFVDSIPRTSIGKLNKSLLKARYRAG